MKIKKEKKNKGFSLIELMVATSIFVVIMLSAMGALFILLDGSKNSRAMRISMDNVNFAMESMTRSLRMGKSYYCTEASNLGSVMYDLELSTEGKNCESGKDAIAFIAEEDPIVFMGYKLENDKLFRCERKNSIDSCASIVSPEVNISDLRFFTFGSDSGEGKQAGTYIIIRGEVKVKDEIIPFSLQTMVSARNF